MSTKTNCEKCIFADYADEETACAMGIIDKIRPSKEIVVDNKFNTVMHYRCPFAFSMKVYQENITDLGSIEELKHRLVARAMIDYYMVIFLRNDDLSRVCCSIKEMTIKPRFVSFVVENNNNTEEVIGTIKKSLSLDIKWKLHNLLEEMSFQESLDTIFSTNTDKNNISYFWINSSENHLLWNNNILKINEIITIEQPYLHALFRHNEDGLFLTFNNYENLMNQQKTGILDALKNTENPIIRYYG